MSKQQAPTSPTVDTIAEVVSHIIEGTVLVETTLAQCIDLKADVMSRVVFNEYLPWHHEHIADIDHPTVFLRDLVLWVQERTRHHITEFNASRTVN